MILKKIAKRIFPRHSKRGMFVIKVATKLGLAKPVNYEFEYERWINTIEPHAFLPVIDHKKTDKPLFSIVIPFYNPGKKYLSPLFDSIVNQSFGDWELIAADGSTNLETSMVIKEFCHQDDRIKYHKFTKETDISGNTNQALKQAAGEYIVFCDHDDVLSPHALNEVAWALKQDGDIDIVYSDEDKLTDNGKLRHSPLFKPDWSPHTFIFTNYTNHLSVIKKSLVDAVGGLRSDFNGAQDYDLLLRIHRDTQKPLNVKHIDKILYHWREADGSTATNHNSKSYAFEAGRKALQEHIDGSDLTGSTENIKDRPGYYLHKLTPRKLTKAVVYVGVSDDMLINKVVSDKLEGLTARGDIDVVFKPIKKNDIDTAEISRDQHTATFKLRMVAYPHERDWLERLMGALEISDVACIAPRILASDYGRVVDMGIMIDADGNKIPLFKDLASDDQTSFGHVEWVRDVDELTGTVIGYPPVSERLRKYNVVWSYVMFSHKPVFGEVGQYNGNLQLKRDKKGIDKVEVNG